MDLGEVVPVRRSLLQPGDVRRHHVGVLREAEDQGDVDADAIAQHLADGGAPFGGGRDLDQSVGAVDDLPEFAGLGDGGVVVMGEIGGHLDRDSAVHTVRGVKDGTEYVARVADVGRRQGHDRLSDVGAVSSQFRHLCVIARAVTERSLEDRRVRGDADDGRIGDEVREIVGLEAFAGEVVEPDGNADGGEIF